jgi:VWFA-related protein
LTRRAWLGLAAAAAAQEQPVFRATVRQVRIDAEVTAAGKPVDGLDRADFVVYDNGRRQTLLEVSQLRESLDLLLVFDVSGSMKPAVEKVAAAARTAFSALRPGDRVGVAVFGSRTSLLCPLTAEHAAAAAIIAGAVLKQPFEGGTRLREAVDFAVRRLATEADSTRRRAILVATDNMGQRSAMKEKALLERIWEADATVSGLLVKSPYWEARQAFPNVPLPEEVRERYPVRLNRLAEESGGAIVASDDPGAGFTALMDRIRRRYSLYYAMPQDRPGRLREVRVELAPAVKRGYKDARVSARKKYFTPSPEPQP